MRFFLRIERQETTASLHLIDLHCCQRENKRNRPSPDFFPFIRNIRKVIKDGALSQINSVRFTDRPVSTIRSDAGRGLSI